MAYQPVHIRTSQYVYGALEVFKVSSVQAQSFLAITTTDGSKEVSRSGGAGAEKLID